MMEWGILELGDLAAGIFLANHFSLVGPYFGSTDGPNWPSTPLSKEPSLQESYLNKEMMRLTEILSNGKLKNISILKGPCLAKELARKKQTSVIIANKNVKIAKSIGKLISTRYYLIEYSNDVAGIEVCSAIKNIYSMIIGAGQSLNSSSNLFQKSILEMRYLIKYICAKNGC